MLNMVEVHVYLSGHLSEPIKVDELARHLHFSTAQVYRDFKRQTGCSPQQYINDYKLEQACSLIGDENRSFQEISSALGFRYESHFFRLFKNVMGVTPLEYRLHTSSGRK